MLSTIFPMCRESFNTYRQIGQETINFIEKKFKKWCYSFHRAQQRSTSRLITSLLTPISRSMSLRAPWHTHKKDVRMHITGFPGSGKRFGNFFFCFPTWKRSCILNSTSKVGKRSYTYFLVILHGIILYLLLWKKIFRFYGKNWMPWNALQ